MDVTTKQLEMMIAPKEEYKQLAPVFHVHDSEELTELERRIHLLEAHVHMVPAGTSWPICVTVVKKQNGTEIRPYACNEFTDVMPLREENNPARIETAHQDHVFLTINENNYEIYFREK
mgnify:CR=1 FL=1